MNFLLALYGSQYYELTQKGKDGAKGRFNGNIFLSAFVLLIFMTVVAVLITFSSSTNSSISHTMAHIFPYDSGKNAGKILALPAMALCYFIIANTVGSLRSYNLRIEAFNQLPVEEKNKANKKVLVPFFIVFGVFFILLMSSLRN